MIDSANKEIKLVCQSGKGRNYLQEIKIKADRSKYGKGPTGQAIKKKKPVIFNDLANNPLYEPWREAALKRHFRSSAAFPIMMYKNVVGVLNLYSEEVNFFDEEEIRLLKEATEDLGFGLEKLEEEQKRA